MRHRSAFILSVVSTLVFTAAMAMADGPVFEDYFVHEMRNWDAHTCCWTVIGYANGKLLRQKSSDPKLINTRVLIADRSFENSTIETKVRFGAYPSLSESKDTTVRLGAGMVFGFQDESNYYLYRLAGDDTVVLGKVVDGEWEELASKAARKPSDPRVDGLEDAPWYTLKVVVENGNDITCYLDGSPVFSADGNEDWTTGRVGFTTWNALADFDYIKIW